MPGKEIHGFKKGLGKYHVDKSRQTAKTILSVLGDEWLRYGEIVRRTGFSTATVSKHLKRLEKSNLVHKRIDMNSGEYPYPVYYRISSNGKKNAVKLQIIEKISQYQVECEPDASDYRFLLSNVSIYNHLSPEERREIDQLLDRMEELFHHILGVINTRFERIFRNKLTADELEKLEFFRKYEPLHHSFEARFIASRVTGSIEEEKRVTNREKKELDRFGITYEDMYEKPQPFVTMNRMLKHLPLTPSGYDKYLELDKRIKEAEPIVQKQQEALEVDPEVCAVFYNHSLWAKTHGNPKQGPA